MFHAVVQKNRLLPIGRPLWKNEADYQNPEGVELPFSGVSLLWFRWESLVIFIRVPQGSTYFSFFLKGISRSVYLESAHSNLPSCLFLYIHA
jgi:hypothetical protein